jgi:hypothetical protein
VCGRGRGRVVVVVVVVVGGGGGGVDHSSSAVSFFSHARCTSSFPSPASGSGEDDAARPVRVWRGLACKRVSVFVVERQFAHGVELCRADA